jgi:hypothetical protein
MIYNRYEAKRVAEALARTMKLTADSLCFCGCGKSFQDCCGNDSPDMTLFLENVFADAVAYRDSQGGTIKSVPVSIWKKLQEKSLSRLGCVYPGCGAKAINSHLIPENVLRTNFGGHCKASSISDGTMVPQFIRVGIGRAGCLPVFCAQHDNALFKDIDRLEIDLSSEQQLFRLAFKAIAFSLRHAQYLLGIDSQIEIARPFLLTARNPVPVGHLRNTQIDISAFSEKYIRFLLNHGFLTESAKAYEDLRWNFMSYFHRALPRSSPIFFSGFLNPSHDLEGRRVNPPDKPIAMACTVFAKDNSLNVLLACPGEKSTAAYRGLIEQLGAAKDDVFVTAINNLLTVSADKPLMAATVSVSEKDLAKIGALQAAAARSIKSTGPVFDLRDRMQAVAFISSGV